MPRIEVTTGAVQNAGGALEPSSGRCSRPTPNNEEFGLVRKAELIWRYLNGVGRSPSQLRRFADAIAEVYGRRGVQSVGAAAVQASELRTAMRPVKITGEVLTPLAIRTDPDTVANGSGLEGGWDAVDRVMATAGLASGAASTLALAGVITLSPPAALAVTVVGAATAGWCVGKWTCQNRENIAGFMVDRWNDANEPQEGSTRRSSSPCATPAGRSASQPTPLGTR